jgi:hypothetical protein
VTVRRDRDGHTREDDMTDIVERLRVRASIENKRYYVPSDARLDKEAAAEIERLRADKVGKQHAEKMFDRLRAAKDAPAWGDLIGGIDRYIANKPADREWLNPGTFINQGRWEDQMPPCSDSPSREL